MLREEMSISQSVLDKIRVEEKKHYFTEFGGYLIVNKRNVVKDVIFDMDQQSSGHVDLGSKQILSLPIKQRNMVRGWFHKHPIVGLSSTDNNTIDQLTEFWGECYTMVLQSNGKMLVMKTIYKEPTPEPEPEPELIEENPEVEEDETKKNTPKPLTTRQHIARFLLGEPIARKKNTYTQVASKDGWTFWGGLRNSQEVFKEEIPFGKTNFKPTFTDDVKKFKLWHPKLGGITSQYTIPQLMSLQEVPFLLPRKVVVLDKEKVNDLLLKKKIQILQCSGYIDLNGKVLFEGDNIKFTTPWKEGSGTLTFEEGVWNISNKSFLFNDKQTLTENVAIEFLVGKGGVRVE